MNPVILLSGGSSTKDLAPLLLRKNFDVAILDPSCAEVHRQKFGERIIPIIVQRPDLQQAAVNETVKLTARVFAEQDLTPVKDDPTWAGFANRDLDKWADTWLPRFTLSSFTEQIYRISLLDELLKMRRVKMCVTHEDATDVFGGLVRWAKARRMPTMHVPHGNCYALPEISPDVHETSICDYLAATPHMEKFYRARGYAGEIKSTGSPCFDHWSKYRPDKEWACRALKLDPNKPIVMYFSSWGQLTNAHDSQTRFEETLRAVLLAGFEQLIIKLHPGEAQGIEQSYCEMANKFGARCIVTRLYFEVTMSCADCLVTLGPSNICTDATIMDVPSVVVKMPGYSIQHAAIPEIDLIGDNLRIEAETIMSVAREPEMVNAYKDFLYQNRYSDQAAKNVVEWIAELVR